MLKFERDVMTPIDYAHTTRYLNFGKFLVFAVHEEADGHINLKKEKELVPSTKPYTQTASFKVKLNHGVTLGKVAPN